MSVLSPAEILAERARYVLQSAESRGVEVNVTNLEEIAQAAFMGAVPYSELEEVVLAAMMAHHEEQEDYGGPDDDVDPMEGSSEAQVSLAPEPRKNPQEPGKNDEEPHKKFWSRTVEEYGVPVRIYERPESVKLWYSVTVDGRKKRGSLRTADPSMAEERAREIARRFAEVRPWEAPDFSPADGSEAMRLVAESRALEACRGAA